uniref:biotin/lipoyl-binding protein n=1 Tax=Methylicorpusculum oleiharenae TaxID=1338687 RepID=UPI002ED99791
MKNRKKTFLSALVFCSTVVLKGCQEQQDTVANEPPVRPLKLLTIGDISSDKSLKMPGTVRASDRVDLAFQVSGPLIELPVKEGQPVKKGDLLARIDPRDYETNLRNTMGTLGNR